MTCSSWSLCAGSAVDRSCVSTGEGRARRATGRLYCTGDSGTSAAPGVCGCAPETDPASETSESSSSPRSGTPDSNFTGLVTVDHRALREANYNSFLSNVRGCVNLKQKMLFNIFSKHSCLGFQKKYW